MSDLTTRFMHLVEAGRVPDALVRWGIRRRLAGKLAELRLGDVEALDRSESGLLSEWWRGPVALVPELANEQHYEVAPAFFESVLGPRMKYSCARFEEGVASLEEAEHSMLELTCERAGVRDGMRVLDLGCGWGSLTLWIAEQYPHAQVLGVSNSKDQREFILARAAERGLGNVEVVTEDVNRFEADRRFDRVVSVEMVEHVRNHPLLLSRVARWLEPGGRLFLHHFSHRDTFYPYEPRGEGDWMARHFFSGGIMPSDDYFLRCQQDLAVIGKWRVNGTHYQKTCEAWLARMDAHASEVMPALEATYGREDAPLWFVRWRLFFLACAELFGYRGGSEWFVTHVLMEKPSGRRAGGDASEAHPGRGGAR